MFLRGAKKYKKGIRGRKERGAALVEAAIIFIPLCIIVFGIVEYGFIFKDSLTISSATRAGARTASAEPRAATFFTDTVAAVHAEATGLNLKGGEKLYIYKANPANGMPASGSLETCASGGNCREFTYNAGSKKFNPSGGSWNEQTQVACLGGSDSVGVGLRINHDALTGFFKNLKLQEKTVMRLEPLSSDCS